MTAHDFLKLARTISRHAYGVKPPTEKTVSNAAWLLLMTWAHESGAGLWRRQTRFMGTRAMEHIGAFGCMQCEVGSITDSLLQLQRDPALAANIRLALASLDMPMFPLDTVHLDPLLYTLQRPEGDIPSIVLARLHYLRVPEPIPGLLANQARYAKRYYNTPAGKATPEDYAGAALDLLRPSWDRQLECQP